MSARMYEDLRDMLRQELNAIVKKGELTKENLEFIHKIVSSLDKTEHLLQANDGGYSNRRSYGSYGYANNGYANNSYDYANNSYEYSRGRHGRDGDGDGRYSENYTHGYSGHDEKTKMVDKLRTMAQEVSDPQTKMMIQDCIRGIEG